MAEMGFVPIGFGCKVQLRGMSTKGDNNNDAPNAPALGSGSRREQAPRHGVGIGTHLHNG